MMASLSERTLLRQLQKTAHTSSSATSGERQLRRYGSTWTEEPTCSSGFRLWGEQFFLQFSRAGRKATPLDRHPLAALEIQVQLGPGGNSADPVAVVNNSVDIRPGAFLRRQKNPDIVDAATYWRAN